MSNRRNFIKGLALAGIATSLNISCSEQDKKTFRNKFLSKDDCMKITGTFIDELSRDLPFHNWGMGEWDSEFRLMKTLGINTVILPYAGQDLRLLYPSTALTGRGLPQPSFDKLELLLSLADEYGFKVYCGLYNTQSTTGVLHHDLAAVNQAVSSEIWEEYGSHHGSFAGWYINREVSVENEREVSATLDLCHHCKSIAADKQVVIAPWIDGNRLLDDDAAAREYEARWSDIMARLSPVVDVCVIQDTSVSDLDCARFYRASKAIAQNNGIRCWGNAETYDAQMPVRLYSTDFDHLRIKLSAASTADFDKVITYEFSHFMSPQSVCQSGSCLLDRYKEYFDLA